MIKRNVDNAASRIREHIRQTPFEKSELISKMTGAEVWLKMENQQFTGCLLYTSPSPRDATLSRMPSSA